MRLYLNPADPAAYTPQAATGPDPLLFHSRLPGYAASPLVEAPELAARLGIARLWVKDESSRLGLPSFKILGASWALYRALEKRMGITLQDWQTVQELAELVARHGVPRFVAATDGNHGHAVARMATMLGADTDIFVPAGMARSRIDALRSEGARVTVVDGSYEAAVQRSAREEDPDTLVISDTSWPGYTDPPSWVIDGYATIFQEADAQLEQVGEAMADVMAVQIGVGALATAVVRRARRDDGQGRRRTVVGVEPEGAACVQESVRAGELRTVPGPHESIMAGLNCDTPSMVAWQALQQGIDGYVAIDDEASREAMRLLARAGIVSGETGAAGLAGLLRLAQQATRQERAALGLTPEATAFVISTEGATDPGAYRSILESGPAAHTEETGA